MPPHSRTETRSLRALQQANAPSAEASSDDISDQLPVSFLAKQPPGLQGRALLTRLLAPGRGEARRGGAPAACATPGAPAWLLRGVLATIRAGFLLALQRLPDTARRQSLGCGPGGTRLPAPLPRPGTAVQSSQLRLS